MIALYIIGGFLLLLFLVGMAKCSINLIYNDDTPPHMVTRLDGIVISRWPEKKKKVRPGRYSRAAMERRAARQAKKLEREKKRKKPAKGTKNKENDIADQLIDSLSLTLESLKMLLPHLGGRIKVDVRKWHITVGTKDAAKTALLYAAAEGVTGALFGFLDEVTTVIYPRTDTPYVEADFAGEHCHADIHVRINIRIWQRVALLFDTAKDLILENKILISQNSDKHRRT